MNEQHRSGVPPESTPEVWNAAHPAFIAIQFFRAIRGLIVPAVLVLASQGVRGAFGQESFTLWLGLLAALVILVGAIYSWRVFRWRVSDRQVIVKSGIVSKQERTVAFERIQAVNIEEQPLDRIFGVVRLKIETAGTGDAAEITIEALRRDAADALRTHLIRMRRREGMATDEAVATDSSQNAIVPESIEGELVAALSTGRLLLAGVTSGRIGPAAAILGFAAQFGSDLVPDRMWERLVPAGRVDTLTSSVQAVLVLVIIVGVIAWGLSIASVVLSYGGFTLRRTSDQLVLSYGLLDRKRLTVPVRRVQAVRITEGMLRQPFGLAEIRYESAGQLGQSGEAGVLFPLVARRDVEGVLQRVLPDFSFDPDRLALVPLPPMARMRYVLPGTVTMLVIAAAVITIVRVFTDGYPDWLWLLAVPVVGTAVYSLFEFADAGWTVADGRLIVRRRAGGRETALTQFGRVQHRRATANWFQRRAGLATFTASIAAGGTGRTLSVVHLRREEGEALIALLAPRRRQEPTGACPE